MDSYGSDGGVGVVEEYDLDETLDEEKTYELWCSLTVKVKAYFETSTKANKRRPGGAIIDKEFQKKLLSLIRDDLPQTKETSVVLCTVGTEGSYKVLYTALENGLVLRWRCKGNKSDLTGVLKGHKGMVTTILTIVMVMTMVKRVRPW